jgi:tRNA(fMet)-specific endonuclease VapC
MKYLTDATFIIDAFTGQSFTAALLPDLIQDGMALSLITYMELWEGVYGDCDPRAAEYRLRTFLRPLTVLPFSRQVAVQSAHLRYQLRRLRRPVQQRALDLLVAATALRYGLTLVTSDTDFDDIPGLTVLNPRTGETRRQPV